MISRWSSTEDPFTITSLSHVTSSKASAPYPRGFVVVVVVDCGHAANMVGAVDVIGWHGGPPVAGPVALQEAQREQAEVGLVSQVDEAQAGIVGVGRSLLVGCRLLVAVDAAAQQLLVLWWRVVFTARRNTSRCLSTFLCVPTNTCRHTETDTFALIFYSMISAMSFDHAASLSRPFFVSVDWDAHRMPLFPSPVLFFFPPRACAQGGIVFRTSNTRSGSLKQWVSTSSGTLLSHCLLLLMLRWCVCVCVCMCTTTFHGTAYRPKRVRYGHWKVWAQWLTVDLRATVCHVFPLFPLRTGYFFP